MNILVTGGAGYIGSHTCKALAAAGVTPIAFDNLSNGNAWSVKWGPLVRGDIADATLVRKVIRDYSITSVIHFAASAYVGESMKNAAAYFSNNVASGIAFVNAILEEGVKNLVFSSSCAIYGEALQIPIREDSPATPVNAYGETKYMFEVCLRWYARIHGLKSISLRYFNAAGADPDGEIGEAHDPETHLIPLAIYAALGLEKHLTIFGTDYPTHDGTCIRDFIHVSDLARAHVLALERLRQMPDGFNSVCNLGTGIGSSVAEVIREVERASGTRVPVSLEQRRAGDPPALVALASKAKEELAWIPACSSLGTIVSSAWEWHKNYTTGIWARQRSA